MQTLSYPPWSLSPGIHPPTQFIPTLGTVGPPGVISYLFPSHLSFQVEKKAQTTVLTAALLLSGIPAEVINRSMDTYRRMGDVFADLCVYFFTFILSHEILQLFGSETPWQAKTSLTSPAPPHSLSSMSPSPSVSPIATERCHLCRQTWVLLSTVWKRTPAARWSGSHLCWARKSARQDPPLEAESPAFVRS